MKLKRVRLGDVFSIKQGFAFKSSNYVNRSNYRLVTLGNFANDNSFKFNNDKAKYYKGNFPNDVELKEMDLILPLTEQVEGLLGNSAFVPNVNNKHFNFVLNQRVGKIICNDKKIDKKFLHYLLSTNLIKDQMEAFAHGTRQRNISPEEIYKIEAYIPTISVQSKIGNFLYSIERKIDNNNKICKELESMAKTIYDYWFLQFEFPDKDGKPYKSNGGKMIWNDQLKQEIPEGWEVKKLSQIESNIITGKTPSTKSKDNFGKDVPFICIGDIRRHCFIENTQLSLSKKGAESQKNKYLQKDSLCVSCIATPGLVGFCNYISQTNQQINSIVFDNKINKYFLYFNISEYFKNTKGTKSGNTFANMNKQEFSSISVIYNEYIVKKFYDRVDSYFEKIKLCEKENQQLKSLRDFLLPLLMNGQVKIKG